MSTNSDQITIAGISLISAATQLLSWSFISQYGGDVIFEKYSHWAKTMNCFTNLWKLSNILPEVLPKF